MLTDRSNRDTQAQQPVTSSSKDIQQAVFYTLLCSFWRLDPNQLQIIFASTEMQCSSWFFFLVSLTSYTSALLTGLCRVHHAPNDTVCGAWTQYVNCSNILLYSLPVDMPTATQYLDLSLNYLHLVPRGGFALLHQLQVLLLNRNNISLLTDGAFAGLVSLRRLDLSCNRITTLGGAFSQGPVSLEELKLGENQLMALGRDDLWRLSALRDLDLGANHIRVIHARAFDRMTSLRQLQLHSNQLSCLGDGMFAMLRSLEVLNLRDNLISVIEAEFFAPLASLAAVDLAGNNMTTMRFKTLLSIHSSRYSAPYSTLVWLSGNPWHCDCDLQRIFRKLCSVQRLLLADYLNLTCSGPPELRGQRLEEVGSELCVAETVTVLIITATVVITVVAAVVMAERNRKKRTGKHWTEDSDLRSVLNETQSQMDL